MIEKRRTAKKDYIAKKAIDVFSALGYKESSLQDIATKGKFSKAGIYHYFKSKSELLSYILLVIPIVFLIVWKKVSPPP